MTTAVRTIQPDRQIQVADADRITASWPDLLRLPIENDGQRNDIAAAVRELQTPAPQNWTMARVAALLTGYYAADVPAAIVEIEAEDWADALRPYPAWAITKAVRWWKGEGNPKRRQKPLEGDIAARARFEMGAVIVAEKAVARFDRGGALPAPDRRAETPASREVANAIMELGGYPVRRFGGDA